MMPADATRFAELLTVLAETFNAPLSEARLDGYWLALGDLDLGRYETAVTQAMRQLRFFPTPAELRELADPAAVPPREERLAAAWLAEAQAANRRLLAARDATPETRQLRHRGSAPSRVGDTLRVVTPGRPA